MAKISYELTPRDVLFFRDARPMDVDKDRGDNIFNVGHGANWPRPDLLFSAVIHTLIRDSEASDEKMYRGAPDYGSIPDLRVTGPFPFKNGKLYLPMPLDWDMKLYRFDEAAGVTDIPDPLTAGFADRCIEKKSYPQWISLDDYVRYLKGEIGKNKGDQEPDEPPRETLFHTEPRVGTTLDAATGASKRVDGKHESGQYEAEYLRLEKGVTMRCEIECEKAGEIKNADVRFGGQGGLVRFEEKPNSESTEAILLERQKAAGVLVEKAPTCFVRWTLLTPALFMRGWYPNWLGDEGKIGQDGKRQFVPNGKVMIPAENVARRPGETRSAYRERLKAEMKPFKSAHLVAARIGDAVVFSGYDTKTHEKPTELAVPAGSCYVFECADQEEAAQLFRQLNLKARSDLGEKGFGFGICSYVKDPEVFKVDTPTEPEISTTSNE